TPRSTPATQTTTSAAASPTTEPVPAGRATTRTPSATTGAQPTPRDGPAVAKGAVAEARNKNATASTASAPGAPVDGNRTPAVTAATAASAPEPARNHTDYRPPSQVATTSTASTTTTVTAARSAARSTVTGWVPTGARGAPTRSVPRIDHLTPMSRSAWCGSPKVRPTAHGVPTPVPRVPRQVAQRPPRAAPTWTIGNQSVSSGPTSVN